MFGYENIKLSLAFNAIFFIISLLLIIAYSFYVYRYTLPPVSNTRRFFLAVLRALALILIAFIIFEPILVLTEKKILQPVNLFFVDNSRSMTIDDGTDRIRLVNNFIDEISQSDLYGEKRFYSFGSKINSVKSDSLKELKFSESSTNYANIIEAIKNSEENLSTITIISDGVITDGSAPIYNAKRTGIPFYNFAVGDSSKKRDVELKSVTFNDYIYSETATTISATVLNNGFADKNLSVELYEGSNLISQKSVLLDKSGVNSVSFEYKPIGRGEKKIQVKTSKLEGENSIHNNSKSFFVNILENKINILLIAGKPSADLTFIKTSLSSDLNFNVNTLTQITSDIFLEPNQNRLLDSADIIYFIDFPNQSTNNEFLSRVYNKIKTKNVPLFLLISGDVVSQKFSAIEEIIPFSFSQLENNYLQVQPNPETTESSNPLINHSDFSEWENLPPIPQPISNIRIKPESRVLLKIKVNGQPRNNPLLVTRNIGSKRSIALIGHDIWKWKLQTAKKDIKIFDNFFSSSARWLNAPNEDKKVRIKSSKKFYSTGELIEFSAQVYDELFNPLSDAEIKLNISSSEYQEEISLNSIGNGLYEGTLSLPKNGDYRFNGTAFLNGKNLGSDNGSFNVGDVDLELVENRMNFELLNQLSIETNGKSYTNNDKDRLIREIIQANQNSSKEKTIVLEIRLWSSEILLFLVIILFSIEWFLRKRSGML